MAIFQLPNGRWRVDVEPLKGKRFRKTLKTKAEALRFESICRSKLIDNPDWSPKPTDQRRLSVLIAAWYDLHGHTLRDGLRRKSKLLQLSDRLGDPPALQLTPELYANHRRNRLAQGVSAKTLNNELGYIRAVYNELVSLGIINFTNPLASLKPLPLQERELSWLTPVQITELLHSISTGCHNPHVLAIVLLSLATGSRWSEAEKLTPQRLQQNTVTFSGTKSGKVRSVPVSAELASFLRQHWHTYGPFTSSISAFRRALTRTSIELPRGQAAHVLRHTFASHFMQNGGNILTLQKILGHSTIIMTMRYSHLAPDHLTDAIRFGPAALFDIPSTPKRKNP